MGVTRTRQVQGVDLWSSHSGVGRCLLLNLYEKKFNLNAKKFDARRDAFCLALLNGSKYTDRAEGNYGANTILPRHVSVVLWSGRARLFHTGCVRGTETRWGLAQTFGDAGRVKDRESCLSETVPSVGTHAHTRLDRTRARLIFVSVCVVHVVASHAQSVPHSILARTRSFRAFPSLLWWEVTTKRAGTQTTDVPRQKVTHATSDRQHSGGACVTS